MGAYQDRTAPDYSEPSGGCRWVTGEPWGYTDWFPGEPNNDSNVHDNGEDAGEFDTYLGNRWNDYPTRIHAAVAPTTIVVPARAAAVAFPIVTFPVALPTAVFLSISGFGVVGTATMAATTSSPSARARSGRSAWGATPDTS
jgi:hypothetical protein